MQRGAARSPSPRQRSGRIACFVRHARRAEGRHDYDQVPNRTTSTRLSSGCSEKSTLINAHKKSAAMGEGARRRERSAAPSLPVGRAARGTSSDEQDGDAFSRVQRPRTEIDRVDAGADEEDASHEHLEARRSEHECGESDRDGNREQDHGAITLGSGESANHRGRDPTAPPSASGHFAARRIGRTFYPTRSPSPHPAWVRVGGGIIGAADAGRPRHHRPLVRRDRPASSLPFVSCPRVSRRSDRCGSCSRAASLRHSD